MPIKKITVCSVIAALYVALSFSLSFLSYSPIQIRISEALTVIPFFGSWGIYAVSIGCFISNLLSPYGILDIVLGSAATVLGTVGTYLLSKYKPKLWFLAPLPAVLSNTLIIPIIFCTEAGIFTISSFALFAFQIFVGEALSCFGLGIPTMLLIKKNKALSKYFYGI